VSRLELKSKATLSKDAVTLATSFEMVRYHNVTYMPVDFETQSSDPLPPGDRTIWLPLNRQAIQRRAQLQFDTLFGTDAELKSFEFMVAQAARPVDETAEALLIRTKQGLRELNPEGKLIDVTGDFRPNAVLPMLNEDRAEKSRIRDWLNEILDSEEEAESLLLHLATSLAPGWSAVKYVLLLGDGRNGKSLLMRMLKSLYGAANVSSVTRQQIAESSPVASDLNGKLLNAVFDGQAIYLKDSGNEKSAVAGESFTIRMLYDSAPTTVQTNALFIEGLQKEPKTQDKSSALQKRLVRFMFPKIYTLDRRFEKQMLDQESLGAFLSLLIDHYVHEEDLAIKLAPTQQAMELQLEQMYSNSLSLQFLKYIEETDPLGADGLLGEPSSTLVTKFQSWRIRENDLGTWADPDVLALFGPIVNTERKSVRENGKVRKQRLLTSYKDEARAFIDSLTGADDDTDVLATLVED
jgi:hypothetical protein